jgi:hypothetical protein
MNVPQLAGLGLSPASSTEEDEDALPLPTIRSTRSSSSSSSSVKHRHPASLQGGPNAQRDFSYYYTSTPRSSSVSEEDEENVVPNLQQHDWSSPAEAYLPSSAGSSSNSSDSRHGGYLQFFRTPSPLNDYVAPNSYLVASSKRPRGAAGPTRPPSSTNTVRNQDSPPRASTVRFLPSPIATAAEPLPVLETTNVATALPRSSLSPMEVPCYSHSALRLAVGPGNDDDEEMAYPIPHFAATPTASLRQRISSSSLSSTPHAYFRNVTGSNDEDEQESTRLFGESLAGTTSARLSLQPPGSHSSRLSFSSWACSSSDRTTGSRLSYPSSVPRPSTDRSLLVLPTGPPRPWWRLVVDYHVWAPMTRRDHPIQSPRSRQLHNLDFLLGQHQRKVRRLGLMANGAILPSPTTQQRVGDGSLPDDHHDPEAPPPPEVLPQTRRDQDFYDYCLVLQPQEVYAFWATLLDFRQEMLGPETTQAMDQVAEELFGPRESWLAPSPHQSVDTPRPYDTPQPCESPPPRVDATPGGLYSIVVPPTATPSYYRSNTVASVHSSCYRPSVFERAAGTTPDVTGTGPLPVLLQAAPTTLRSEATPLTNRRRFGLQHNNTTTAARSSATPRTHKWTPQSEAVAPRLTASFAATTEEGHTNLRLQDIPHQRIPRGIAALTNRMAPL